ncbi:molybdenum cofactor synthesis protein [Myxococcota bacterium]|nr:molybdenum cofactor synthesis protein [Myxococcota bacterium]MBU1380004.1 molybdenum cofactor synthesis protein [Myxococcota bacterium]MBU1496761.1 molybdenum cofactor synthesis protein [Myxococcota bacterium]
MGIIESINVSIEKGTEKTPFPSINVNGLGLEGDAHAGQWHRQVSFLAAESVDEFRESSGIDIKNGDFGENILTRNIDLHKISPLDRIVTGSCVFEVTQIGKKCHGDGCSIFSRVGKCIMPVQGVFARVISPGRISTGDSISIEKRTFRSLVITLSDSVSSGINEDISGKVIERMASDYLSSRNFAYNIERKIIPDDALVLENILAENSNLDLIITTGGTGIGPRDITPEVVSRFITKEMPGIMDHIRNLHGSRLPSALISRSIAGVRDKCQIYALPGNPKACNEYMTEITKIIEHAFLMLHSIGH